MSSIVAFFEIVRLFIDVCHFLCLVFHVAHGTSGRDDSYSWAIAHEDGVELEVDDHGDLEDAAAVLVFSDELLRGLVWIYLLCSLNAQNLMVRGLLSIFLLTPMTSSKNFSLLNLGFSRKGSLMGSTDTILSRAKLYRTKSFFTEPKRNHFGDSYLSVLDVTFDDREDAQLLLPEFFLLVTTCSHSKARL